MESKRGIAHRCYPLFEPWLHRQPNLQTRLQAAPIRTPGSASPPATTPGPGLRISGPARSGRFGHVALDQGICPATTELWY